MHPQWRACAAYRRRAPSKNYVRHGSRETLRAGLYSHAMPYRLAAFGYTRIQWLRTFAGSRVSSVSTVS